MGVDLPRRDVRRGGCGRPRVVASLVLAAAAFSAAAQTAASPSILSVLAGYLPFAGVGFFFGVVVHLVRIARRKGEPIDPGTMLIRGIIGAAAGVLGLWPLDAAGSAAPPTRLAATAGAAILGEGMFRLAAAASQRRPLGPDPGGDP